MRASRTALSCPVVASDDGKVTLSGSRVFQLGQLVGAGLGTLHVSPGVPAEHPIVLTYMVAELGEPRAETLRNALRTDGSGLAPCVEPITVKCDLNPVRVELTALATTLPTETCGNSSRASRSPGNLFSYKPRRHSHPHFTR